MLEKRMVNGLSHDRLGLDDYFTTITIQSAAASSSFTSSFATPCKLLPPTSPPKLSPPPQSVGGRGVNYIEHVVSKLDTLAGVAIKYGVEVADIKKMNGLVTDHQMFALKMLHIPLPGRHPPSPIITNDIDNKRPSNWERTPPSRRHSDFFDSFQSLKLKSSSQSKVFSDAMSSPQGYYGLKTPTEETIHPEGFEMAVYSKGGSLEEGISTKSTTPSISPSSLPRKCKSVANGFYSDNGNMAAQETKDNNWGGKWIGKFVRRRTNSEVDLKSSSRDTLLKEENNSGGMFSALASKGLTLRPKTGSRNVFGSDADGWFPMFSADPLLADNNGVRKSSSTPSFLEPDDGSTSSSSSSSSSSSIWPTSMWSLKPDLQALSAAAMSKPIFDGLPLPSRKSKAARD